MPAGLGTVLADLRRAFAALDVRWYVFGAQAVAAAGVPRLTADVDITVEVPPGGAKAILNALLPRFRLREIANVERFIRRARVIPMLHASTELPVDVVLAGPGLEEEMLGRVEWRKLGRTKIPFVATNDLVALKVLAGRDKDLGDVAGLLRAKPEDLSVVTARARIRELGVLLDDSTLLETFDRLVKESRRKTPPRRKRR